MADQAPTASEDTYGKDITSADYARLHFGPIAGSSTLVRTMFTDAELEQGRELALLFYVADSDSVTTEREPQNTARRLIATAVMFEIGRRLFVLDVIPANERGAASSQLEPALYLRISSAVIDLAIDRALPLVYFPAAAALTAPGIVPYGLVRDWHAARLRRVLPNRRHWRIESCGDRPKQCEPIPLERHSSCFSLVHTFAAPPGSQQRIAVPRVLREVLTFARREEVPLTLCLPVDLLQEAKALLLEFPGHACAIHSQPLRGGLMYELQACAGIEADDRGYYIPAGAWLPPTLDRTLRHLGVSWVVQGADQGPVRDLVSSTLVARLAVSRNDTSLESEGLDRWVKTTIAVAQNRPDCIVELSCALSEVWLPGYQSIVRELRRLRPLASCGELASRLLTRTNAASGPPPENLQQRL